MLNDRFGATAHDICDRLRQLDINSPHINSHMLLGLNRYRTSIVYPMVKDSSVLLRICASVIL